MSQDTQQIPHYRPQPGKPALVDINGRTSSLGEELKELVQRALASGAAKAADPEARVPYRVEGKRRAGGY